MHASRVAVMLSALAACGDNRAPPDAPPDGTPGFPAFTPEVPEVIKGSGAVMSVVHVVPILFPNDALHDQILDFPTKLASVWPVMVGEYGVGGIDVSTPVEIPTSPTGDLDTMGIEAFLLANLDGTHPEWGPIDATTLATSVYTLFYPDSVVIKAGGAVACQTGLGGFHGRIASPAGPIIYAVIPRCLATPVNPSALDQLTAVTSHELVEAATDPDLDAYGHIRRPLGDWSVAMSGAEVGDMCQNAVSSFRTLDSVGYHIQRTWSNASAASLQDPCVPIPAEDGPYFNAVPFLGGAINFINAGPIESANVAVGQTIKIPVRLFSDAPMPGPFSVHVAELGSGTATLQLALDRAFGVNGETLHLTIKALSVPSGGYAPLLFTASFGTVDHVWAGGVAVH